MFNHFNSENCVAIHLYGGGRVATNPLAIFEAHFWMLPPRISGT